MNINKELLKKEILNLLNDKYKVDISKIHYDMDLFSHPMFLRARDALFLVLFIAKKYDIQLSRVPDELDVVSINSIAHYLMDLCELN